MSEKILVSQAELEVLKIVWKIGPSTSTKIVDNLIDNTEWKPRTIQTLINRLVKKGALEVDKVNRKSYIYSPSITEEEYKSNANKSFLEKLYNGSLNMMVASFIKDNNMSQSDIKDLKNLLEESTL